MESFVLLHHNGKIVGTAKYFTGGCAMPAKTLHGLSLSNYAGGGEDLVVFNHVQIFREHLNVQYPYSLGGPEPPPSILGDMNKLEKYFKAFIAWDNQKLSPQNWGCELQDQPVSVSESVLVDRDKTSSRKTDSLDRFTRLRNTNTNHAISPIFGESTTDKGGFVTREEVENTSFSVRRFSRIRGKRLSSASAFRSSITDTHENILQSDGFEKEEDREAVAHREDSKERRFEIFLNGDEGEQSAAEVHSSEETGSVRSSPDD